jgi:hypothetical protein
MVYPSGVGVPRHFKFRSVELLAKNKQKNTLRQGSPELAEGLRANGSHLKIIIVSSAHAEHVEAQ